MGLSLFMTQDISLMVHMSNVQWLPGPALVVTNNNVNVPLSTSPVTHNINTPFQQSAGIHMTPAYLLVVLPMKR